MKKSNKIRRKIRNQIRNIRIKGFEPEYIIMSSEDVDTIQEENFYRRMKPLMIEGILVEKGESKSNFPVVSSDEPIEYLVDLEHVDE